MNCDYGVMYNLKQSSKSKYFHFRYSSKEVHASYLLLYPLLINEDCMRTKGLDIHSILQGGDI